MRIAMMLMLALVGCSGKAGSSDSGPEDTGEGSTTDWRTGAYADVELTFESIEGEGSVTTWSFRLEDGDPNSGSRYEDLVEVEAGDDGESGHYFHARHKGCPEDAADPDPPDDRPVTIVLRGGSANDYTSTFDLDLMREGCNTDDASIECAAGPGPAGEDSYFVLDIDEESGSLWSGTLSSYALCFQVQSGEDPLVGHAQVDVAFVARVEEP